MLGDVIYEEQMDVRERRTHVALKKLYGSYGTELAVIIAANGNFYTPTLISLYQLKGTDYEKELAPMLLPLITKLYQAKVPLLAGSDFADKKAGIRPGYDLHGELALFVKAGMTTLAALQTATINPAKCLDLQDSLGTIEKGKLADLVILNANPLEDINNTRKIDAVFWNGRCLPRTRLTNLLNNAAQTNQNKFLHSIEIRPVVNNSTSCCAHIARTDRQMEFYTGAWKNQSSTSCTSL